MNYLGEALKKQKDQRRVLSWKTTAVIYSHTDGIHVLGGGSGCLQRCMVKRTKEELQMSKALDF